MLIEVNKKKILIKEKKRKLKSYEKNQLYFYGFKRNPDTGSFYSDNEGTNELLIKVLEYFKNEKISFSVNPECKKIIDNIKSRRYEFQKIKKAAKDYKDGIYDLKDYYSFSKKINKLVKRRLKDHQIKAAFHQSIIKNGANFSVPGSGKTSVVLSVFEKLRLEKRVNFLFIIGPASCFGPWQTEFLLNFGRKANFYIFAGGDQLERKSMYYSVNENLKEIYFTTFQTLNNDQQFVIDFFKRKNIKPFLVVDEAHYIKQINGLWANAVLKISKYARYRCVLTGTPIPKSYEDIFNLFKFLWPDNEPLDEELKVKILSKDKKYIDVNLKRELESNIGPLFYRVRKSDLGLLEPNFNPAFLIDMNKFESIIYDAIQNKIRDYAKNDYMRNIDFVNRLKRGRIIRLRQAVSYVKLTNTVIQDYGEHFFNEDSDLIKIILDYDKLEKPAKLEFLIKIIEDIRKRDKKIVIWSSFIGSLKLISTYLNKRKFRNKIIYGKVPTEKNSIEEIETRESIIKEFLNIKSDLDILLANPAACSESISLHKTCYHSIYYDLSYNCAQYLQSLDRIHRVGGSELKKANYYFLQYNNTIDQDIKENLDEKAERMYELIDKEYSIYSLDMFEDTGDDIKAFNRIFGKEDV